MTKRRVNLTAFLVLFLLGVIAATYWRFGKAVEISAYVAQLGSLPARVTGPGSVQARVPVALSARLSVTLTQIHVDVGDTVQRGQLLATLDDRDVTARRGVVAGQQEALVKNTVGAQAAVAKANTDLVLAQSKYQRDMDLMGQAFVSQSVVDVSLAAVLSAKAGVDAAKASLAARVADAASLAQEAKYSDAVISYTKIVAPMDGIVIQRLAEAGTTVAPGAPILRLVDPKTLWVATRVDESVVGRVQIGQVARIKLRTGETLPGKVVRIALQSDAATRELDVHVAFDTVPKRFAIDQEAEVSIHTGQDSGIVVPLTALLRDSGGRQGVLVIEQQRTRFVPVDTSTADNQQILLSKGLQDGETIVAIAKGIASNQSVRALATKQPSADVSR
jgi:HlyD family secretion protein